nr:N-6 DNA methylase [Rhodoferax sp.]
MQPVDLYEELHAAGVLRDSIVRLDEAATPRHIRYLDLLGMSDQYGAVLPDAVIESSGQPYLYVVRRDRLGDPGNNQRPLAELIRILACRSDARFLAVVRPGSIDVYPVGLFEGVPDAMLPSPSDSNSADLRGLLSGAMFGSHTATSGSSKFAKQWLEALLFRLLTDAAKGIRLAAPQLSEQQVIALVGRALFFRFLADRGIVVKADAPTIANGANGLEEMFSTPAHLTQVCRWMDCTFNGDLLSIGGKDYETLLVGIGAGLPEVCRHLTNIQYRAVGGQLPLNWGGIEFRHVPVDMLSQVYEDFAHEFVPELAQATSIHFTPRRLAEIVLDGAFSAVQSAPPHAAKVLDPAVGGGVFLVLAFRRLVAERWREDGVRPTRTVIRKILKKQLTGFDINRDALNITALSLYLAALELDPTPSPLTDLKFEKLIGTVLHAVDQQGLGRNDEDALLGSLSSTVLNGYRNRFDIVIGNPPWTGFNGMSKTALNKTLGNLMMATNIEGDRDHINVTVRARYGSPDIPFLLAATRWAKPKGALGFALHARFIFQPEAFELRKHVFKSMRVTGIMNFSALRQDPQLWPTNDAPFVLLVARNAPAQHDDSFYFISPKYEFQLSKVGQYRIDPNAATPILQTAVQEEAYALRALYKGGALGMELLKRIQTGHVIPLGEYLSQGYGMKLFNGYKLGKPEERIHEASHLLGLPIVTTDMSPFGISISSASPFLHSKAQRPRSAHIFKGPLLLFRASPKQDRQLRGALFFETDVAYTNVFSSLPIAGHEELRPLAHMLHVLSYSDLLLYYQLLTSPKFGVERDSGLQADLEGFPLVTLDSLTPAQKAEVHVISDLLQTGAPCWSRVDKLVSELYGLSSWDRQLIQDTLEFELPFSDNIQRSGIPTTPEDRAAFADTFNNLVEPFAEDDKKPTRIVNVNNAVLDGWRHLHIGRVGETGSDAANIPSTDSHQIAALAESYWASRLTLRLPDGNAVVGYLDQRRYWSKTQARLLALEWLQGDNSLS